MYKDVLFAYYPSTDPEAYLELLEKIARLPVKRVFPAHHSLNIHPEIIVRMRDELRNSDRRASCTMAAENLITVPGGYGYNT